MYPTVHIQSLVIHLLVDTRLVWRSRQQLDDNVNKSMKFLWINLSFFAFFSTQGNSALFGYMKSDLKVLLIHVEWWVLVDKMENIEILIFRRDQKDPNILWKVRLAQSWITRVWPHESLHRTILWLGKWPNKGN